MLREKQAESDLQKLRNLIADGLNSGEPQEWNRDEFLQKVRDKVQASTKRN